MRRGSAKKPLLHLTGAMMANARSYPRHGVVLGRAHGFEHDGFAIPLWNLRKVRKNLTVINVVPEPNVTCSNSRTPCFLQAKAQLRRRCVPSRGAPECTVVRRCRMAMGQQWRRAARSGWGGGRCNGATFGRGRVLRPRPQRESPHDRESKPGTLLRGRQSESNTTVHACTYRCTP